MSNRAYGYGAEAPSTFSGMLSSELMTGASDLQGSAIRIERYGKGCDCYAGRDETAALLTVVIMTMAMMNRWRQWWKLDRQAKAEGKQTRGPRRSWRGMSRASAGMRF